MTIVKADGERNGTRTITLDPSLEASEVADLLQDELEEIYMIVSQPNDTTLDIESAEASPVSLTTTSTAGTGSTLAINETVTDAGQAETTEAVATRWSRPSNTGVQVS